jgi:hypothetical protein
MTGHARVNLVKLTGKVQNGNIAVDLPEGTRVTIVVEEKDLPPGPYDEIDENGDFVVTPELEAELDRASASTEWVPLEDLLGRMRNRER